MTLLAAWVGVDAKKDSSKVASIYFATDSRISWPNGDTFDESTKSFGMENHPDIFAFCGDVLFPTIAIPQIIQQADKMMLYPEACTVEGKFEILTTKIAESITRYPKSQTAGSFTILYATRDHKKDFHCYRLDWSIRTGLSSAKLILPIQSNIVVVLGSGAREFLVNFDGLYNHPKYNNFGTSRTVYHCFTDTLNNIENPQCGGAPQIVGLYRVRNAINFGIVDGEKRFLGGSEINNHENAKFVEWRNENFERIDPRTMQILDSAQKQPKI
jgi:hypothetical protein